MPVKEISFPNSRNHLLQGVIKYPDTVEPTKFPPVIVLHKFGDNSDQEFIVDMANLIYPYGYISLRFDFHGHGRSGGDMSEVHITQQIDDVISAISFIESLPNVDLDKVTLIGHGMGADVAILTAARDSRVKCLVCIAARSDLSTHLKMFSRDQLEEVSKKGYTIHHRHGRINKEFINHLKRYDIKEEIKKITAPILFLHGQNDFSVRWENSKELYLAANEPKRFEISEGADHWFRGPKHRKVIFDLMIQWINRHIKHNLTYASETTEKRSRARLV